MTTSYNLRLEVGPSGRHRDIPADSDRMLDDLAGYSPAISITDLGRLEIIISLPADSIRQAITTGLAVAGSVGHDVVAVEAMTSDDFDRRLGLEPLPELVGITDAAVLLGITRQAVLARINAGTLAATKVGTSYVIARAALR